ncbi:uncharacterized protein LOC110991138 [Acanthaster planci]|uniref:Uncharacterized protein LOC110991138 n=1 Tax=Acanthaster planci TaxID=133434 RepID=A0A8B8A550_ACAPL|nr:uncharacterized protein LOC110991138 [Acanthaster planci]
MGVLLLLVSFQCGHVDLVCQVTAAVQIFAGGHHNKQLSQLVLYVVVFSLVDVALGGLRYLDIVVDHVRIDVPADATIYDGGIAPVNFCTYFTPDNGAALILNRFDSERYKLVAFLATDDKGSNPTAVTQAVIPLADQLQPLTDGKQVILFDADVEFDLTHVDCYNNRFPYACVTLGPADVLARRWQPSDSSVVTKCVPIICKPEPLRVDLDFVDVDIPRHAIIVDSKVVDVSLCVYFTPKDGAAQDLNALGAVDRFKLTAFLATTASGGGKTAPVVGTINKLDQTQVLTDGKQFSFYDAQFSFDLTQVDCTDGAFPYVCTTLSAVGPWELTANSVHTVCTPIICLAQDNFQAQVTCEDRQVSLSCPAGQGIHIAHALYGRIVPGNLLCPSSAILTTKCLAPNALGIVRGQCEGSTSCSFTANNHLFGDPCGGTHKYLHVFYLCREKALVKTVCEREWLRIDCPAGVGIRVIDANYGRYSGENVCGARGNKNCVSRNALPAVQTKCQGKRWCKVPATDAFFSDPCPSTSKYLRIYYKCDYPIMRRKSVCQGRNLGLDCGSGNVIKIDYALYGRVHGSAVCSSSALKDFNCQAENALSVVKNKCEGKKWCSVPANNYTFGNPCKGTHKYLFVRYYCKKH